jgi:hypothetical protein
MIRYSKRHKTLQETLNAIRYCADLIHKDDCSGEEFDKLSGDILSLIERVIRKCLNNVELARTILTVHGLDVYLDVYLELNED